MITKEEKIEDANKQIDLVSMISSSKLEQQLININSIDTKSNILAAIIGFSLAVYFQLITSDKLSFKDHRYFIIFELFCLLTAGYLVFRSFLVSKKEVWRNDPNPNKLIKYVSENPDKDINQLKTLLSRFYAEAYDINNRQIDFKYTYLRQSAYYFFAAISIIIIHFFIVLYNIGEISFLSNFIYFTNK